SRDRPHVLSPARHVVCVPPSPGFAKSQHRTEETMADTRSNKTGAVAGGLGGAAAAAAIDPAQEERYWKKEYRNRPYYTKGCTFDTYQPAYRYGVEAGNRNPGESFWEIESRLSRAWAKARGDSELTWGQARDAVRDAYDRTLQLHEERLQVDKEQVDVGEVAVRKETVKDRKKIDVPVEREEIVIERRPAR